MDHYDTVPPYTSSCLLPSASHPPCTGLGDDDIQLDDRARACVDGVVAAGVGGGTLVNAHAAVVLPAQVEVDVFGDNEAARGPVAVLVHGRHLVAVRAQFLADQRGRVVAQKGFDGQEAAADYHEVGFDHAEGWVSGVEKGGGPDGNSHPHCGGDDHPGLVDGGQ